MAAPDNIRQFAVVRATDDLRRWHEARDVDNIEAWLRDNLRRQRYEDRHGPLRVAGLPSAEWSLQVVLKDGGEVRTIPEPMQPVPTYTIPLAFNSEEAVHDVRAAVHNDREREVFLGIGADIPFNSTDCWCPGEAATPTFGSRAGALKLIRAGVLANKGLRGKNVNVVVIDRGLDPQHINIAKRWLFGTRDTTPVPSPDNHAMMIARHIQKVAPEATIFDCAILPEHISDIGQFMAVAHCAYVQMLADIAAWKQNGTSSNEWVFVNAWAIYNRHSEFPPGDYTDNPHHQFNLVVEQAAVTHRIDQVFAAGNCGVFCPKMNCGRGDRGPGQSIFGANAHPSVLTTGAVRNDGMWLGYPHKARASRIWRMRSRICACPASSSRSTTNILRAPGHRRHAASRPPSSRRYAVAQDGVRRRCRPISCAATSSRRRERPSASTGTGSWARDHERRGCVHGTRKCECLSPSAAGDHFSEKPALRR